MSTTYEARELLVLQQLAWQTVSDPHASKDDKRAARARLEKRDDDSTYDPARLTTDELSVSLQLTRKALGTPFADDPLRPLPHLHALYELATHAQTVADDARLAFHEASAQHADDLSIAHMRRNPRRCPSCGRHEDDGCREGREPSDDARRARAAARGAALSK